ncbi:hypothetical protein IAT40_006528 [Kwoniella sp. CBS 6097]
MSSGWLPTQDASGIYEPFSADPLSRLAHAYTVAAITVGDIADSYESGKEPSQADRIIFGARIQRQLEPAEQEHRQADQRAIEAKRNYDSTVAPQTFSVGTIVPDPIMEAPSAVPRSESLVLPGIGDRAIQPSFQTRNTLSCEHPSTVGQRTESLDLIPQSHLLAEQIIEQQLRVADTLNTATLYLNTVEELPGGNLLHRRNDEIKEQLKTEKEKLKRLSAKVSTSWWQVTPDQSVRLLESQSAMNDRHREYRATRSAYLVNVAQYMYGTLLDATRLCSTYSQVQEYGRQEGVQQSYDRNVSLEDQQEYQRISQMDPQSDVFKSERDRAEIARQKVMDRYASLKRDLDTNAELLPPGSDARTFRDLWRNFSGEASAVTSGTGQLPSISSLLLTASPEGEQAGFSDLPTDLFVWDSGPHGSVYPGQPGLSQPSW